MSLPIPSPLETNEANGCSRRGTFGIAMAAAGCYKERWAFKACCSCEEFAKWPLFGATAFLGKAGVEFGSWTGRTLLSLLNCCASSGGGLASSSDQAAASSSVECNATMIPMFFVGNIMTTIYYICGEVSYRCLLSYLIIVLPVGAILGALNLAYWAAIVLPMALIGTIGVS
jgi:hypothetical protein